MFGLEKMQAINLRKNTICIKRWIISDILFEYTFDRCLYDFPSYDAQKQNPNMRRDVVSSALMNVWCIWFIPNRNFAMLSQSYDGTF